MANACCWRCNLGGHGVAGGVAGVWVGYVFVVAAMAVWLSALLSACGIAYLGVVALAMVCMRMHKACGASSLNARCACC